MWEIVFCNYNSIAIEIESYVEREIVNQRSFKD